MQRARQAMTDSSGSAGSTSGRLLKKGCRGPLLHGHGSVTCCKSVCAILAARASKRFLDFFSKLLAGGDVRRDATNPGGSFIVRSTTKHNTGLHHFQKNKLPRNSFILNIDLLPTLSGCSPHEIQATLVNDDSGDLTGGGSAGRSHRVHLAPDITEQA